MHNYVWDRIMQKQAARFHRAVNLANQGNAIGQYEMGLRYKNGWGVEPEHQKATDLLDRASRQHHAGACYELSRFYLERRDYNKALEYTNFASDEHAELFSGIEGYNQQHYIQELKKLQKVIDTLSASSLNSNYHTYRR